MELQMTWTSSVTDRFPFNKGSSIYIKAPAQNIPQACMIQITSQKFMLHCHGAVRTYSIVSIPCYFF